jgi:hypothetical protein
MDEYKWEHDESLRDSKVPAEGMWPPAVVTGGQPQPPTDHLEWQLVPMVLELPPPNPGDRVIEMRQDDEPDEPFVVG